MCISGNEIYKNIFYSLPDVPFFSRAGDRGKLKLYNVTQVGIVSCACDLFAQIVIFAATWLGK